MNNNTKKGANNGTVVRKKDKLKEDIIKLIKSSENPLSTSDLTLALNKAWHTIDRTCLMLQIDDKIVGFKVGKMNLWRVK